MIHWRPLVVLVSLSALLSVQAGDLSSQIDRLIEKNQIGVIAGQAPDEAFLRRIHLDLLGRIPSVSEARAFLQDKSKDKRVKLVDELLKRTEASRHLASRLDLIFMERRADKYVKSDPWREFLFDAVQKKMPYHKLVHTMLASDGAKDEAHARAKFYLDREAEPSALTRDIGRIFFGMDLQCAQCHDHPNIDDYLQRDYYGIYAFVNRLSIHQPDKKKKAVLAEKAEGATDFKSVFTNIEGSTAPRLPGESPVKEPKVEKGKEWKVAPDKKDKKKRAIPTYSRRQQLPKQLAAGSNQAFRKNIVNRLWAHMMGRGIVEPVDFHHSSNPPSHPELLDLLAKEFAAMNFDIRQLLRAIALSKTYQRSFAMPEEMVSSAGELTERIGQVQARSKQLDSDAQKALDRTVQLRGKLEEIYASIAPLNKSLGSAKAEVPKLEQAHKATLPRVEREKKNFEKRQKQFEPHFQKAKAAREKDPNKDDPKRKLTADERRAASYEKQLKSYQARLDREVKKERDAFAKLDAARKKVAEIESKISKAKSEVPRLESEIASAHEKRKAQTVLARSTSLELRHLKALADFGELKAQAAEDKLSSSDRKKLEAQIESAHRELTTIWSRNFAVAGLNNLSPEQLAYSLMTATGEVDKQRDAGRREFEKKSKEKDPKKKPVPNNLEEYMEQYAYKRLQGKVTTFVNLFNAGGADASFFASADQALYFENGGDLRGWLSPSGTNLVARLRKITDPKEFADELYLATLTRYPSDEECEIVARLLKGREKDLQNAAQEMAWGLLCSTEFRFKH
ncbi:MAG: hypothetical protein CMO80_19295 [Verrucomicrobiales bacterium]|nr:hypothetical protein [Verrucomicrobiales bacterium]